MAQPATQQKSDEQFVQFPDHDFRILVFEAYKKHPGLVSRKDEEFLKDQIGKPDYWRLSVGARRWLVSIADKLRLTVPQEYRH